MDIDEEVEKIKKELLDLVVENLKQNKIEADVAQAEARELLAMLPVEDHKDLLSKLKNLGEEYDDFNKIYLDELEKDSELKRNEALNQMRDHIKQGQVDNAISAAKSLTNDPQNAPSVN